MVKGHNVTHLLPSAHIVQRREGADGIAHGEHQFPTEVRWMAELLGHGVGHFLGRLAAKDPVALAGVAHVEAYHREAGKERFEEDVALALVPGRVQKHLAPQHNPKDFVARQVARQRDVLLYSLFYELLVQRLAQGAFADDTGAQFREYRYESQGYVFLEALFAGLPVVGLDVGYTGESDRVFRCQSPQEMADAVAEQLRHPPDFRRESVLAVSDTVRAFAPLYDVG